VDVDLPHAALPVILPRLHAQMTAAKGKIAPPLPSHFAPSCNYDESIDPHPMVQVPPPFRSLRRAFCTTLPSILGGAPTQPEPATAPCASEFLYGEEKAKMIEFHLAT
jgi:hypothetical protein